MEKGPEIRIIGGASIEKKEQVKEEIEQALFNHFESLSPQMQEQLKKFEYPKSEKELALINFANEETSRLMQEAGIEPYNVPEKNFHTIPPELYKKVADEDGTATTFYTTQGVLFDARYFRDNPVNFGTVALHEMLHLKAHFSMEVEEEGHFNFKAHFLVSFLNSIILSFIRMGVSFGLLFGLVDFGSNPASSCFFSKASHLSKLLWLYGQTLAASFSLIYLL